MILDWSDNSSNPIGSEYIIMEHAAGVQLLASDVRKAENSLYPSHMYNHTANRSNQVSTIWKPLFF